MREAFPSLPFSTIGPEKEIRDNKDIKIKERDNDNIFKDNSIDILSEHNIVFEHEEGPLSTTPSIPFSGELEELQNILHFPEEVALRITDTEYQLFYQFFTRNYVEETTVNELQCDDFLKLQSFTPACTALKKRFDEVCSWATYNVLSQTTTDERKTSFSCLLRIAISCWNIGNFNGAKEIFTGLKSIKNDTFWSSLPEKGKISVFHFLSTAFESKIYKKALSRALAIPTCRVIPCFDFSLDEIKSSISLTTDFETLKTTSSSTSGLAASGVAINVGVSGSCGVGVGGSNTGIGGSVGGCSGGGVGGGGGSSNLFAGTSAIPSVSVLSANKKQHVYKNLLGSTKNLNFNNDTLNLTTDNNLFINKSHSSSLTLLNHTITPHLVLKNFDLFIQHHNELCKIVAPSLLDNLRSASNNPRQIGLNYFPVRIEEQEEDYEVEIGNYNPVQTLHHDHGISLIPLSSQKLNKIDHHILQILHHGTTIVLWEPETPSERSTYVYFRLERCCSSISWHKTAWKHIKLSQDINIAINPEENVTPRTTIKNPTSYNLNEYENQNQTLDEGILDISTIKEISMGSKNHEYDIDILAAGKRFGLTHVECCVSILYGNSRNDNRILCILCPPMLCRLWYIGLNWMLQGIRRQQQLSDRSLLYLKQLYIQLYFEDGCCTQPVVADAIRVFGGRNTLLSNTANTHLSESVDSFDTTMPSSYSSTLTLTNKKDLTIKLKKKKSMANLLNYQSVVNNSELKYSNVDTEKLNERLKEQKENYWHNMPPLVTTHSGINYDTPLDFLSFVTLYRSFSLKSRKDLRNLFDQLSVTRTPKTMFFNNEKSRSAPELSHVMETRKIGLLTRNCSLDMELTEAKLSQKINFDAIAASSILSNFEKNEPNKSQVITLSTLKKFLESRQMEMKDDDDLKTIIQRHEPDPTLRSEHCLSYDGFARYMMDKDNYAFLYEKVVPEQQNMSMPLSNYYIASSHNTYLTGHQLKGESSVELYREVLLTGCRCVELDCWDGEDGTPVIYHGHTFTTKIPFKAVVEAINKSAFIASQYPIILSIENHCSIQQQQRMAFLFQTIFGDKLVSKFLYDSDYSDDPYLPSPAQLKNKILIKNKKMNVDIPATISSNFPGNRQAITHNKQGSGGGFPGRTSSIMSNSSIGSFNEEFSDDEYEDDDDFDNIEEKAFHTAWGSGDEKYSIRPNITFSQNVSVTPTRKLEMVDDKSKKRGTQIARELSDLVIYIQAIKFRGLNPCVNNSHQKLLNKSSNTTVSSQSTKTNSSGETLSASSSSQVVDSTVTSSNESNDTQSITSLTATTTSSTKSRQYQGQLPPQSQHPCYQCSSINEASAKKLCRKHPLALIAHTETQLMRTYPAGLRIDSSNFNPLFFWTFGIQMVALNYQTEDIPMHINKAMFEETGCCGYVPKPDVFTTRSHLMYRRFNPLEKEFDGLHTTQIVINIVSGQYLNQVNNFFNSTQIEIELIGIPVDCYKRKTKIIRKNSFNPLWNETFYFKVMFFDLTFVRFSIIDCDNNNIIAQRIISLKCLRPGYRHVRLRTILNQPLNMATLFVYTRFEEESLERIYDDDDDNYYNIMSSAATTTSSANSCSKDNNNYLNENKQHSQQNAVINNKIQLKRKMFFLMVYGVTTDEPYTILKITQESTTRDVILQALQKGNNKQVKDITDYILIEEFYRGWEKKDRTQPPIQRVLDLSERPLQAQGNWKGEGKFIFKKIGNDPSSRAWLTSIRRCAERKSICMGGADAKGLTSTLSGTAGSGGGAAGSTTSPNDELENLDNFLVCIYNVSNDIPYAILRVPIKATAQDVLAQALLKARRMDNPNNFILVEELNYDNKHLDIIQRILQHDEIIYLTQANWKTIGRFVIHEKSALITPSVARKNMLQLGRGLTTTLTRSNILSGSSSSVSKTASPQHSFITTEPNTSSSASSSTKFNRKSASSNPDQSSSSGMDKDHGKASKANISNNNNSHHRNRETHSEGETLSDDEGSKESDLRSTISRIKKMSIKKLKSWKS